MITKMKVMMKTVSTKANISWIINLISLGVKNKNNLIAVTSKVEDNNQVIREARKKLIEIFMIKMKAIKGLEMNSLLTNKNLIIFKQALMDIKKFVKEFIFKI
jgi:hypothetical protein